MKVKYLLIVSLMFAMVSQAEEPATNTVKMVYDPNWATEEQKAVFKRRFHDIMPDILAKKAEKLDADFFNGQTNVVFPAKRRVIYWIREYRGWRKYGTWGAGYVVCYSKDGAIEWIDPNWVYDECAAAESIIEKEKESTAKILGKTVDYCKAIAEFEAEKPWNKEDPRTHSKPSIQEAFKKFIDSYEKKKKRQRIDERTEQRKQWLAIREELKRAREEREEAKRKLNE